MLVMINQRPYAPPKPRFRLIPGWKYEGRSGSYLIGQGSESIREGFEITMIDGKRLEVSRRNAAELKELLSF